MGETIIKFIRWWKGRDKALSKELFHVDFLYHGCGLGNYKDVWLGGEVLNPPQDFKILKSFFCNNEASVVLEETDEITNLYYRHSFYIREFEGKIVEIIETKESVQK